MRYRNVNILSVFTFLCSCAALLTSCVKDGSYPGSDGMSVGSSRTVSIEVVPDGAWQTKSEIFTDPSFESGINEAAFAFYDASSGGLVATTYTTGGRCEVTLPTGDYHNVYCLVNMNGGDAGAFSFPLQESGLSSLRFDVSDAEDIAAYGMPMAGSALWGGEAGLTISVRRLMARLVLKVDHSAINAEYGATAAFSNSAFGVGGVASALYPFMTGGSRALYTTDCTATTVDYDTTISAGADVSEEIILYVPENCQGTWSGSTGDSMDKVYGENSNSHLSTYVSFTGVKNADHDAVSGNLTYRFYPGSNSYDNFDLRGGYSYKVTLVLSWNGMFLEGSWMVERDNWVDGRTLLISAKGANSSYWGTDTSVDVLPGDNIYFAAFYDPTGATWSASGSGYTDSGWKWCWDEAEGYEFVNPTESITDTNTGKTITGFFEIDYNYGWGHNAFYGKIGDASTSFNYNYTDYHGTSHTVTLRTNDGAKTARVTVNFLEPTLFVSNDVLTFEANDYSNGVTYSGIGSKEVILTGNCVDRGWEVTTCDNSDFDVSYNSGKPLHNLDGWVFYMGWKTGNTGSTQKVAHITFKSSTGKTASVTAYQNPPSSIFVDDDDNGGGGENQYN